MLKVYFMSDSSLKIFGRAGFGLQRLRKKGLGGVVMVGDIG